MIEQKQTVRCGSLAHVDVPPQHGSYYQRMMLVMALHLDRVHDLRACRLFLEWALGTVVCSQMQRCLPCVRL